MCVETKQYLPCSCYTVLHRVCASHIAHTHKQIDNAPCPDLRKESVQQGRRCLPNGCEGRKDEFYTFEATGRGLFEHEDKKQDAWRKERAEREQRRAEKMIGEFEGRDLKRLKWKEEDEDEDTSMAMVPAFDDPNDISAAFKSFRDSCPNKDCLEPDIHDGVCHNCGAIVDIASPNIVVRKPSSNTCTNPKCLISNVTNGYCCNCGIIVDRERFSAAVGSETCFNKECHEPNVAEEYCRNCKMSNSCSNLKCDTPVVEHGVCKTCLTIVDEKAYMADVNARFRSRGLPRYDEEHYINCPSCLLPDVLDGTCESCQKKVPICANDECKSYNVTSGSCKMCGSAFYDEHGILGPGAIFKKPCAVHGANVKRGVCQVCGILVYDSEAAKGENEAGDMDGIE